METIDLLEKLEDLTQMRFEFMEGRFWLKNTGKPLSQEMMNYILSDKFDIHFFQQNFSDMASVNHTEIIQQLNLMLAQTLDYTEYGHYVESIKVKNKLFGSFSRPDLTIVLLEHKKLTGDSILENPHTIVEVLSPSTEKYDRNQKKEAYQTIPSLQEYLLIAQDEHKIEQYIRDGKTNWTVKIYDSIDQTCILTVGVKIKLSKLYQHTA